MKSFRLSWVVLIALIPLAAHAQKRTTKPKPIRATVTIKTGTVPLKPLPSEADEGLWTSFELNDLDLQMLFPSKHEDILDDVVGPVRSFQATTKNASYLLAIRDFGTPVARAGLNAFLEAIVQTAFAEPGTRVIEKKDISYGGWLGKQVITLQSGKRSSTRVFVLNGKLFAMSVTVASKQYDQRFEKWIQKFFDSFYVKVPTPGEV